MAIMMAYDDDLRRYAYDINSVYFPVVIRDHQGNLHYVGTDYHNTKTRIPAKLPRQILNQVGRVNIKDIGFDNATIIYPHEIGWKDIKNDPLYPHHYADYRTWAANDYPIADPNTIDPNFGHKRDTRSLSRERETPDTNTMDKTPSFWSRVMSRGGKKSHRNRRKSRRNRHKSRRTRT